MGADRGLRQIRRTEFGDNSRGRAFAGQSDSHRASRGEGQKLPPIVAAIEDAAQLRVLREEGIGFIHDERWVVRAAAEMFDAALRSLQLDSLEKAGCKRIFSGTDLFSR